MVGSKFLLSIFVLASKGRMLRHVEMMHRHFLLVRIFGQKD